jgi:hypothetical protein
LAIDAGMSNPFEESPIGAYRMVIIRFGSGTFGERRVTPTAGHLQIGGRERTLNAVFHQLLE